MRYAGHYHMSLPFLQVQRYEAASTIYGPHTLSAYIQLYRGLAKAIATVIKICTHVSQGWGDIEGSKLESLAVRVPFLRTLC